MDDEKAKADSEAFHWLTECSSVLDNLISYLDTPVSKREMSPRGYEIHNRDQILLAKTLLDRAVGLYLFKGDGDKAAGWFGKVDNLLNVYIDSLDDMEKI